MRFQRPFFFFIFFNLIAILSLQKLQKSVAEGLNFHFLKKIESFYCIVREIISFKVKTNQKGRLYSNVHLFFLLLRKFLRYSNMYQDTRKIMDNVCLFLSKLVRRLWEDLLENLSENVVCLRASYLCFKFIFLKRRISEMLVIDFSEASKIKKVSWEVVLVYLKSFCAFVSSCKNVPHLK